MISSVAFFLIWKAQGSDFGPLTAHADWDISCFYLISPGKCQGSTSDWTTAISFHIISSSLFTAHINLSNKGSRWNKVVNYSTRLNSLLHHVGVGGCCHPSGGCSLSFNLNRVLKYLDLFKVSCLLPSIETKFAMIDVIHIHYLISCLLCTLLHWYNF